MATDPDVTRIADEIVAALPQDKGKAAQVALSVAAAKCIDADLSDDDARTGLAAALRFLRGKLRRGRVN